jgi:hypothetical protein
MGYTGCWDCAACGAYDGDHHLRFLMDGDGSIYRDLVSTITADGAVSVSYRAEDPVRIAVKRFKQARFEHGETPIACAV